MEVDWLTGQVADGAAVLANDGGAYAVSGLYRATATRPDGMYVGGWVVLPDGTQRGSVRRYETPLAPGEVDDELDLEDPTVGIPGGEEPLTAVRVTPNDDLQI